VSTETRFAHTVLESERKSKTFVGLSAFGNINGSLAALRRKAQGPARLFGSTFLFTILKSGNAFGVFLTCSPLTGTFLLNALLGVGQGNSSGHLFRDDAEAVIFLGAFGNVNGSLVSLGAEAEGPAGGSSSAFLVAVLNRGHAFGVLLASSPLVGAFLLDARQGIS
jgi:hypothetical protein